MPEATATLDWRLPPVGSGRLMLFEAFITDQQKTADTRHIETLIYIAIEAFQRGMRAPQTSKVQSRSRSASACRGNDAEDGLGN